MAEDEIPVSDFYKLAVLDCLMVTPIRVEYTSRFWGYFKKEDAAKWLEEYENGKLMLCARDFTASIVRVKDRIFDIERRAGRKR